MPTSGQKTMFINTRERAISTDIMRLQRFVGSERAEVMRFLLDAATDNDGGSNGVSVVGATTGTPLRATILNGLCFKPTGTTDATCDPGVIALVDPDAVPLSDDSPLKLIKDAGLVSGTVFMTAGAGSDRWDVFECSRSEVTTETDNRDIFNPATGLFAATTVNKVNVSKLQYRIRTGAAGGGLAGAPAFAAGWLPLAYIRVKAGGTTWADCEFWDVRPLASDRWRAPFNSTSNDASLVSPKPRIGRTRLFATLSGNKPHDGEFWGAYGAYNAGGRLLSFPINDVNYRSPGFAATASTPYHVYLMFPLNLPRWARYTTVAPYVPGSQRGVAVMTNVASDVRGNPSGAVSLPPYTGMGGTETFGVLAWSGAMNGVGDVLAVNSSDGDFQVLVPTGGGRGPNLVGTLGAANADFAINPVANLFPRAARKLRAYMELSFLNSSAGVQIDFNGYFALRDGGGNEIWQGPTGCLNYHTNGGLTSFIIAGYVEFPWPTGSTTYTLRWQHNATPVTGTVTPVSCFMEFNGWSLVND